MRLLLFLIVIGVTILPVNSQGSFSLQGKVIDSKTKQPIPFVSVFFASTALGANSAEDGSYKIDKIPSGKFQLVASSVGYKKFSMFILFSDSSLHLEISLSEDVTALKEIVVRPNRSDFNKYFSTFKQYFLGVTPNAYHCSIKNKDAIDLRFDKEEKTLYGYATEPIQIENKSLGYTIYFMLEEFELSYKKDLFKFFGVPRFEELPTKSKSQEKHWIKKRDEAYFGSLSHFMHALFLHDLKQNKFIVFRILKNGDEKKINEDSLFITQYDNQIRIRGEIKILFEGQPEDRNFSKIYKGFQTSTITSGSASITLYSNGHIEDLRSVRLDGYLGYRECISNMVPLGYQPTSMIR